MASSWRTAKHSQDKPHLQARETVQAELSKAWEIISDTRAALRHIESKLDVAPASIALFDCIKDTMKPANNVTRKTSRKSGRHREESNASLGKSSSYPSTTAAEKLSRSPLRTTTHESNVKTSCHVGFREPLASYRDPVNSWTSSSEKGVLYPGSGLNHLTPEEKDPDSACSLAEDEISVHYLNDQQAIEALKLRLQKSRSDMQTGFREMRPTETSLQPSSFNLSSNRLETLKQHQPDAKLEKLKQRIRRQWEHPVEQDTREHFQSSTNHTDAATNAKTRKVAVAPRPPSYPGFNTPETKICTPDGKVWKQTEFLNLSAQLHGTLIPSFQEVISDNAKSPGKPGKRTSRPVRKVQRLRGAEGSSSPDGKRGHIISTSSWREGQKLVKQILGTGPKTERISRSRSNEREASKFSSSGDGQVKKRSASREKSAETKASSSDRHRDKRSKSSDRQFVKRATSQEEPREHHDRLTKSGSLSSHSESRHVDKSSRGQTSSTSENSHNTKSQSRDEQKPQNESAEVKKEFLPLEIRGILEDLQLDSGIDRTTQVRQRSRSPTKRNPEKGPDPKDLHTSFKRRHYDTDQVRQYILRKQEERKKRQNEQRKAQRQAEEQKNKRLQELYQKQKEVVGKTKSAVLNQQESDTHESVSNTVYESSVQRPQDTYTKLLLGQIWPEVAAPEKQTKPFYQPSGESDKENKGQERPLSASSSSDLSLSEPLQPLRRSDLETHYPQPEKLTTKGPTPSLGQQPREGGTLAQFLALPKDLECLLNTRKGTTNMIPVTQKISFQGKSSTDFKGNLDRIESLKATAVSLCSRIENEAKKLAGDSVTFPSSWSVESDPKLPNKIAWKKPDSPPERESLEDAFSNKIQKMLSTCATSHFSQEDIPGISNLYRKSPEEFIPQPSTLAGRSDIREIEVSSMQNMELCERTSETPNRVYASPNSSTSSISEGPILSEGSFVEEESPDKYELMLHPVETLKNKEFCIRDSKTFAPLFEFQKEVDKYQPLLLSGIQSNVQEPWQELAKGSPHSVINIFAKSYQLYGKESEEHANEDVPDFQPLCSVASFQKSVSYADDFISTSISESANDSQKTAHQSDNSSASSPKEELLVSSRSEGASSHSSPTPVASPISDSSQIESSKRKTWQNGKSPQPVELEQKSGSKPKKNGSKQAPFIPSGRECQQGSDSDSTMEDLSSSSTKSLLSNSGRNIQSKHSSFKDADAQVPTPTGHPMISGPQTPGVMTVQGQGTMRFSPAGLQQRMSAELTYLGAMEESVRQLCDMERVRGISIAQQETVSLAQILKAQQQQHEQNMAALRQQAEQETHANMKQLEDVRQIAEQTQAEMLQRFHKTLDTATSQNVNRVQEELDRDYLSPTSSDPTEASSPEKHKRHLTHGIRKRGSRSASPSSQTPSSVSSFKERPHSSSSEQDSLAASSIKEEKISHTEVEESVSEELPTPDRRTAKGDSSSSFDDKGGSSAGPINEEGIEELSFRSLLPSEAHRRSSLERQRSLKHESDEESTPDKELKGPFSSGQDNFSKFTLEMVRQYMQEGEMRLAHRAALLRLREKALKEKTKAELAWLEHLKRRLRDKREDDKMPPLRKRQRSILLKLQQEQAEIKRLQEANKAARRERLLILKQQEEIQRIQSSTLRLQEKLKSAESGQQEPPSEGDISVSPLYSHVPSDAESRSLSPVSVSGSETSSIMEKLRKMHSHMDAKFLTKREQQLVQRRLHAQELLEWKKRLDAEELEIRRIEKEALAAWDNQRSKTKSHSTEGTETVPEEKKSREGSPVPQSPTLHTRTSLSPSPEYLSAESTEPSTIAEHIQEPSGGYSSITEELNKSGPSKMSPPRSNKSSVELESSKESMKTGRQRVHITLRPHQMTQSEESLSMTHSEATSDQSDIEGRIRALKEELWKRKSVAHNLKREQKRRQKEKLRAQEAILLKQLQSYNEYIQKAQAELNGEKPSVKSVTEGATANKETVVVCPDSLQRSDSRSTHKDDSEHVTEISSKFDENLLEKSLTSRKEISVTIYDDSQHTDVPLSAKEGIQTAGPLSPLVKEIKSYSKHDSPESSIQSEIQEEVLDTTSHRSLSPLPDLNINVRSKTPEDDHSPNKDHSYSDDFDTSLPFKHSISETPREDLNVSHTTTPGREIPSEGYDEQDEANIESKPSQNIVEMKLPSQKPVFSKETSDPLAGFQLGDRVLVSGVQPGTLRFKGETLFADGIWAGIELDKSEGNNDGSVEDYCYFVCSPLHGIFAPPHKITRLLEDEHSSIIAEKKSSVEDHSFEHKEHVDVSPSLTEEFKPKSQEKTPVQSAEFCVSESHNGSIEEELQLGVPTETAFSDEESQNAQAPLLDLVEKDLQDSFEKKEPEVSSITDSLLQACLKDTVAYLQDLRKRRAQKILQSNQELQGFQHGNEIHREGDVPKQDQRPEPKPKESVEKAVTKVGPSHSILSVLGEEPDWFDEDFGLSGPRSQQLQLSPIAGAELLESRPDSMLRTIQPETPPELNMVVPHSVPEVEQLVNTAVDLLFSVKHLEGDIQEIRTIFTRDDGDEPNPFCSSYKEMLFDLTAHILEEICSPDPRGSQPPWMKPVRVIPSYSRRVRDPSNVQEVKDFLTIEVLNLLSLKKEQNSKTDWQRMMKFGRKKRDRVDHILVQELHEEEALWVNYDEDELFVKMQLADGIFEALIQDTIQVLQCIQNKKNLQLMV